MKTFLLITALAVACVAQQDCSRGACFPPLGELLIGREKHVSVSSTCGLLGTEIYCTPFGQWKMKCCPCDSLNPAGPNAHTIQNILPGASPDKWWQSRKDDSPVTLQLDLKQMFHLDHVMLSFKGPRPNALVIERTRDFGQTWQPALYMATDCSSAFPRVTTATPRNLDHTYCYTLPSTSTNPYQDQRIYYHPLHQYSSVNLPKEAKVEEVSGFTGLRVNLTGLAEVPRRPGRSPSRFYALREIKVTGSCFCHGHANLCQPDTTSNYLPSVQVTGVCECQHNTAGVNCERCADLYNDQPWRPADQYNTHTCKRCECNNHAERCYFDAELYELSGGRSGGVCDGCLHNTAGPQCEQCAANYYRNPQTSIRDTNTCLPCQCDSAGSVSGGQCDSVSGVCVCKLNVEGPRCDRCRAGHHSLRAANPLGCSKCSCSVVGSLHSVCDAVTGQCVCRPGFQGVSCERCAVGFWRSPTGCQPCNCDPNNSISSTCDQVSGQCQCRSGFLGRTCAGCPDNTYGDPRTGCKPCQCNSMGLAPGGCDKISGVCECRPGVVGARCDSCARGHCARYPQCPVCPACFFSLDAQLQNLTLGLDLLANRLDTHTGSPDLGPVTPGNLDSRIRTLENTLQRIRSLLTVPLNSDPLLTKDLDTLNKLRLMVVSMRDRLNAGDSTPNLEGELDALQSQLFNIQLLYNNKRNTTTPDNNNYAGALNVIKNAFSKSTEAEKRAEATRPTVDKSAALRDKTTDSLNTVQPANTNNLKTLTEDLATQPNLTPTALQVCGSNRGTPCTPQDCTGELCPAVSPPCGQTDTCTGALPEALRAQNTTDTVKQKLTQLNNNISQAFTQIQQTQDSASRVRLATDELTNQIKRTRDDLDYDLNNIKDFIKKLKDFLSDPSANPEEVQRVCEAVLGVALPEGAESLRKKLQELQDLTKTLPDSSNVLQEAEPKLQQAQRLLQDALKTRNESVSLQDAADQMLDSLDEAEQDVTKMEKNLQKSLDIINTVKEDVKTVEEVLGGVGEVLGSVPGVLDSVRPLLEDLKKDIQRAAQQAGDAEQQAGGAELEAELAAKDLDALQDQLEKLKLKANTTSEANAAAGRLPELQQNATDLLQDTVDMMQTLTDKEKSLKALTEELSAGSSRLAGLDTRLQELINDIHNKATKLMLCQG